MKTLDLIDSFSEFKEFKNIDRETLMHILEEVFRAALAKRYGTEDNFDIIVNIDKGDLEIFRNRTIVEDGAVKDENLEIAYSDAIKIESDFEVGEELSEPIYMTDFGEVACLPKIQRESWRNCGWRGLPTLEQRDIDS